MSPEANADRIVAVPDTDGELAMWLSRLEELLISVTAFDDEPDTGWDRPAAPFGDGAALIARQRILGAVLDAEHAPAAILIAPNGRFELTPVRFITVDPADLAVVAVALATFGRSTLCGVDELVSDALADHAARYRLTVAELIVGCTRSHGLVDLVSDNDTMILADRLASALGPTVLTRHEHAAYLRLTERIITMFHGSDPLARFLYRG
jgi:hypothetical protein